MFGRNAQAQATIGRRGLLVGTAGALAGAALAGPGTRQALATGLEGPRGLVVPAPRPIPGGDVLPPQIHVWEPGAPAGRALPHTGAVLEGLDVEPSTITDFSGVVAQAYHVGTARGNDGQRYNLETDVRVFQGRYVALDGAAHRGTFALI